MEDYKSLLNTLTSLVHALENGTLSLDQLVELEETTRKLHERSIILRYKAFREKVTGEVEVEAEPEEEAQLEGVMEEEMSTVEEIEENTDEEEQGFEFAIFDDYEDTPETASLEMEIEEVQESEGESEGEREGEREPVAAMDAVAEPEPVREPEPEVIPTPQPPVQEEKPVQPPLSQPAVTQSFLDRLIQPDNSIAGRFAAGKLETLIGAFGLNERLRFINDLFDGSSETFSEAIKALDSQNDLDAARSKAAGYAAQHDWDPEEETVIDFMNYINRRYA